MKNIRLFTPFLGEEELLEIRSAFEASWVGLGPKVNAFESMWSERLGSQFSLAVNSCTAALHLALAVYKFPKGKKVLVPAQTFSATASAVIYNGLEPIFVDSQPKTLGIDFEDLDKKWDRDCVAVIPVHYAGHPVDMEILLEWSKQKKLKVIEDCAHTDGSVFKGKRLGTWGDIGCFSFEEKKIMTTGDGGMLSSDDEVIRSLGQPMRWVGIDKDNWKSAKSYTDKNIDAYHWFYEISELGYKYNMNDLSASIGIAQLKKLEFINRMRSNLISKYLERLSEHPKIELLVPYSPKLYQYQMFGIRVNKRDELILHLKRNGIATGCHYTPLTLQPLFRNYRGSCPYIEHEIDRCITLPLHVNLAIDDVDYTCDKILEFFKQ